MRLNLRSRILTSMRRYCDRIVMAGSIRAARNAGIQQATSPMIAISTDTVIIVAGS